MTLDETVVTWPVGFHLTCPTCGGQTIGARRGPSTRDVHATHIVISTPLPTFDPCGHTADPEAVLAAYAVAEECRTPRLA